jgi:hypothetical protein
VFEYYSKTAKKFPYILARYFVKVFASVIFFYREQYVKFADASLKCVRELLALQSLVEQYIKEFAHPSLAVLGRKPTSAIFLIWNKYTALTI